MGYGRFYASESARRDPLQQVSVTTVTTVLTATGGETPISRVDNLNGHCN
jgi:hypothetical protein